jgi:hypothetical protein
MSINKSSIFKFTNSAGAAFQVQAPAGTSYDAALAVFNQQLRTGGLTGVPVGGLVNAVTQTEGGLAAAASQISPAAVSLAAEIGNNIKLPNQVGVPPQTAITVSEFLNTGVNSQTVGSVSSAQVQGLVATTAAVVNQSSNVITTTNGLGTYGLTADQLQTAGLIKPGIADQVKQDPANAVSILSSPTSWTGKQGATDIQTILDDVNLQTATQQDLMSNSYEQLKQNGTLNGNESADAVGPLVNAATKYGVEPTTQWLNNNAPANVTTQISNFVNSSTYGSTFGVKNQNIAVGIGALSLGVVIAKGYVNTVNRQSLNQATTAVIGNPKIPTPNFPSAGASTPRISDSAAESAVTTAVAALNSVSPEQAIAAVNQEITRSGGSPISVGYGGILRSADGSPVLGGDGKPVNVGAASPTLGSGITSADKASMFGGTGVGAVAGTGQNATPAAGSIGKTLSQAVSSLATAAKENPAVTKAVLSAFGPLGFAVGLALSVTKTVAPAVAPTPTPTSGEFPSAADFEATDWAKEAEAENTVVPSPVPSSEQKTDAAQFGGPRPDGRGFEGSYSNSLRDSPPGDGGDSGP